MSHTRLHDIWLTMRYRCEKPTCSGYEKYGAKGIHVCPEWATSFKSFRDWSYVHGYADNLTIDRIDPKGDYTPENCRWVDQKTQQNNRSNNIHLTYNGETRSIIEWAEITGMPLRILYDRYAKLDAAVEARKRAEEKYHAPLIAQRDAETEGKNDVG